MISSRKLFNYFIGAILFSILVAISSVFILTRMDLSPYKHIISKTFNDFTGQELLVDGPISIGIFPSLKVKLEDVSLTAFSDKETKYILKAQELRFTFKLLPLLWNDIQVDAYRLRTGSLLITPKRGPSRTYSFKKISGKSEITEIGVKLNDLEVALDKSDISGELTFNLADDIPWVEGKLKSHKLYWEDLFGPFEAKQSEKVFSTRVLGLKNIPNVNLKLNLIIDQLFVDKIKLQNVNLPLVSDRNKITIPILAQHEGAQIKGVLEILKDNRMPVVKLNGAGQNVKMGTLVENLGVKNFQKGRANFTVKVTAKGDSVSDIMGSLTGVLYFDMGEATIANAGLKPGRSGTLFDFFKILNPMIEKKKNTNIECLSVNLNAKNGNILLDKDVGIQTEYLLILGTGQVKLKPETIDITLLIQPKQDLTIDLGDINNTIKISGTLEHPKIIPNTGSIIKKGAFVYAAVMSGGSSILLEKLLNATNKERQPCQVIQQKRIKQHH